MVHHDAIAALEALFQQDTTTQHPSHSAQGTETPAENAAAGSTHQVPLAYSTIVSALDEALSPWKPSQHQQDVSFNLFRYNEAAASSPQQEYESYALQALFHTVYGNPSLANRYIYKALNCNVHGTHPLQWMTHLSLAHQRVFHGVFVQGKHLAEEVSSSIPVRYRNLRHHALNLQSLALGLNKTYRTPLHPIQQWGITLQQWGISLSLHDKHRWVQIVKTLGQLCHLAVLEMRRLPYATIKAQCDAITRHASLTSITLHAAQLDCTQLAWPSALKRLKRALRFMPSQPMLWLELSKVYRLIGHTDKVYESLTKTVALMPTLVIAQVELGLSLAEQGCIVEAMERFALAYMHCTIPSQKRRLAYIMADALERHGQRIETTLYADTILWPELGAQVAILNKLDQEGHKPTAATLSHLAKLANTLQQKELAVLACELAIEHIVTPNAQCYINLAFSAWQAGSIDMAVYHYRYALSLDDSNALAHNNLGSIYLDHVHNLEAAHRHFEAALKNNSGFALAHFNMGRLNTRLHHYTEAAHSFACAKAANMLTHELRVEEIDHHLHLLFDRM
jgi:tetratricopeptide (TPR) repeat protein